MSEDDNTTIVRGLWQAMSLAALGTLETGGNPHVSLVTIAPDAGGRAILLLSKLARHTANLGRDSRCALLISEDTAKADPLAECRITVHGRIGKVASERVGQCRTAFLGRHPEAGTYVDFGDFHLYEFTPDEVHLVGGFGRIETFPAEILHSEQSDT